MCANQLTTHEAGAGGGTRGLHVVVVQQDAFLRELVEGP
jgi:hypothetical protein